MMIASYLLGQKYYPVNYNVYKIVGYPALVAMICWGYVHFLPMDGILSWVLKGMIILLFLCLVYYLEIMKKQYFHHDKTVD
jgi:CBS-domain-containing membrane protein